MKNYRFLLLAVIFFTKSVSAQIGNIVIPDGHAVGIEKMLLSADGKYLFTANNQKIIMWDVKQHIQLYSFSLAVDVSVTDALGSFVLSNDGNYVAATGGFGIKCFSTITGKSVFNIDGLNYSATFSADSKKLFYTSRITDTKTYKQLYAILSTNLITLETASAFVCEDVNTCNFFEFNVLKDAVVMLKHPTGWQIADLDARKILFTANVDTKTTSFGDVKEKKFFPILNSELIAAIERKKGDIQDQLIFYNAYSGQKMFSKVVDPEWRLLPAADGTNLLLLPGGYADQLELIDVKNVGSTIKKVSKSTMGLQESESLRSGMVDVKHKRLFYNLDGNVKELQLQSLNFGTGFNREIASFWGIVEHNEQNEQFRIVADNSNYLRIDLKRMVVEKIETVKTPGSITFFSKTGDTLAVDNDGKGYFYDVKTDKKTTINPALFGRVTFESDPRPNLFFGREGKFAYAIKNSYINRGDAQSVYQINLATNTNKKIADFQHNLEIDIKQDLIAGFDNTPTSFIVKCWQLSTGKQIFTKILPRQPEEKNLLAAKFFDATSKIAIVNQNNLQVFNIADGKLVSNGRPSSYGHSSTYYEDSKITISHNASLIAKIYDKGMLGILDTSLSNRSYSIQAHDGVINDAYFSNNDSLIYTAGSDNTIKIFNTATGKIIGTLYIFKDSKDYVFIDPTGRFDGTPEGIKKLYYVKDRKVVTLDKIYEKFYTPNLYQRLLNGEVFDPINIIIKGTPKVKISYAEATRNLDVEEDVPTYQNKTGFADIVVTATTEDDAIDEIRLFHNGKIVTLTTRNLIVADNEGRSQTKKYQLALLPGINNVRAIALNTQRTESSADEIVVTYSIAANNTPVVVKPVNNNAAVVATINKDATLHLIVVGINEYQNKSMSLNYAMADATSFKEELEKDAKTIIANIKTYFVTNSTADKSGITNAFKEVQQNAKAQDVFIFYYAGHGVIGKDKEFYLVPTDVSDLKNVQTELEQKGIASKLLQQYAIDIQAQKQLFILDACQSAGAFEKLLSNDGDQQKSLAVVARSTGTHWMAASGAMQYANEFSSLGHGVFTYVLLQALKGEAASNKMITVNGLKSFLQTQVPLLMKKYNGAAQYPASYGVGNDFPVEVLK